MLFSAFSILQWNKYFWVPWPIRPTSFLDIPFGLHSPFSFLLNFDVATTIMELQQLHKNSSVIKGIVTCNLFLLKFLMTLKYDESNEWDQIFSSLYNQASKVD